MFVWGSCVWCMKRFKCGCLGFGCGGWGVLSLFWCEFFLGGVGFVDEMMVILLFC